MNAIINLGALLGAIKAKGWSGFSDAAANCHVSEGTFKKIARGQIPRLDALFRICDGCGIKIEELIIGTHQATKSPRADVVSGRWRDKQVTRHEG